MNAHASTAISAAKGVFINNVWTACSSGRTLPVVAPAEGRQFAEIAAGSANDIKKSGHGREKGFAALHDMSTLRTIIHKHGTSGI